MMKFLVRIYLNFFGKKVGEDAYGNQYFETNRKDSFGRKKRFCLYNGKPEASKISPEWFPFMHYQIEAKDVLKNPKQYKWQKPALPNLTLSDVKYLPKNHPLYLKESDLYNSKGAGEPFKMKFWKPTV